jgi:hypothetical protein
LVRALQQIGALEVCMRIRLSIHRALVGAALILLTASTLAAQTRPATRPAARGAVPAPGMVAIGVSLGPSFPTSPDLNTGFDLAANVDGYLTRRVSVRGQFSGAWEDVHGHSFTGTVKPMAIDGNVVYNWEGGKIHPYATGGLGFYHFRYTESNINSSDSHFGGNLGGGVEYFFTRHDTITGEVLAHIVEGPAQSALATYKATYWTLTFGYKRYFR